VQLDSSLSFPIFASASPVRQKFLFPFSRYHSVQDSPLFFPFFGIRPIPDLIALSPFRPPFTRCCTLRFFFPCKRFNLFSRAPHRFATEDFIFFLFLPGSRAGRHLAPSRPAQPLLKKVRDSPPWCLLSLYLILIRGL